MQSSVAVPQTKASASTNKERFNDLRARFAIGLIVLFLALTPAWAGFLAWLAYKIAMLVIG